LLVEADHRSGLTRHEVDHLLAGCGTDAQRQIAGYLFSYTQVNGLEAGTEVNNLAEPHALEKAGFTREGIMRGSAFQGGRWHDGVIYSLLRSDLDLAGIDSPRPDGPNRPPV
jgi:RimJ/RimL family protein N-acetyltransferase